MKRLNLPTSDAATSAIAGWIEAAKARGLAIDDVAIELATAILTVYPGFRGHIATRPDDIISIARGKLRIARDLRAYRRLGAAIVPPSSLADPDEVRRGIRIFAQRERLRIAARELQGNEVDVTARELSDLAQVSIEIALAEAQRWAEERFGVPTTSTGERCAFTVLGMGKLGGRELNCGSDVDLLPFYETDEGEVIKQDGVATDQTLHEHFTRVTQRFTATLEDVTEDGMCWRVDLRLRPEGSRGPLVNALAAAERYYETWGRTWERAALVRARPVAGHPGFGARVIEALAPFVWRKAIDPRIAHEMAALVQRARVEISEDAERDLKLGVGGIREAEFFVQSLQLIWGGREPTLRDTNTLEALHRLRARGLVTDRESREVEAAYLFLRRLEHRVQFAMAIQTHQLPTGEMLEMIARSLGYSNGRDLERDLEKTRRRVAARLASLTKEVAAAELRGSEHLEPLLTTIDTGEEHLVLTAIAEGAGGVDFSSSASADLARHLLALARRPDFPLGTKTRDRHPLLAVSLLEALADAADPEQAARLLAAFFSRLATPSVYTKALAEDTHVLRRLVTMFGASAFLGDALVYRPELMESVLFAKVAPTPESTRKDVESEVLRVLMATAVAEDLDPEDAFVGALRHAKARVTMEVGLAELSGELRTRDATIALSALADATLEHATKRALAERKLPVNQPGEGLAVIAMGKLGGREIGYGSDLDIFFVYEGDEDNAEKYVRAAQRVLSLVSTPHGDGPGYELDTRLRPSGSHGLLVVSIDSFARYHDPEAANKGTSAADWERQALIKARACAGSADLGNRVIALASKVAYERGEPKAANVHHLRMRMENELAREGPRRYDVKLGRGGIVDVEFATQWLQMKHGMDPRVRTQDTESAIGALEACGFLDGQLAAVFREGYAMLRRLEQALRVVHGTSASLIEEGAPGLAALARRMGFRDGLTGGDRTSASDALIERYRAVTRDVRAAYLTVLRIDSTSGFST